MGCTRFPVCKGYGGKRAPRGRPFGSGTPKPVTGDTMTATTETDANGHTVATSVSATVNTGDLGSALWTAMRPAMLHDMSSIAKTAIQQALDAMPERVSRIEFHANGVKLGEIQKRTHEAFTKSARKIAMGFKNLLLVGPAGTGKSTIAEHLAESLSVPYAHINCSGGVTEAQLLGKTVPNITTGENHYQGTPLTSLYENGGVFCLDEMDGLDSNMLVCLHGALANGHLYIPATGQTVKRHESFYFVCTANTYGNGASRVYLRNQLDGATLDRFIGATIDVDYDTDLEKALVGQEVFAACLEIRKALASASSRRIWGMRAMLACARMTANGTTLTEAISECMIGWTDQERRSAGVR